MRKRCSRNCVIESLTGKTIPHEYPLAPLSLRASALQEIILCLETASNYLGTLYSRMKSIKPRKCGTSDSVNIYAGSCASPCTMKSPMH